MIDVVDPIDDATLQRYMDNVSYVYNLLEERLYGNSPDEKCVLFVENGRAVMKPDPLTITFPLDGRIELIANEISHYFTVKLLPTSAIWLNEGLSDVSHVHQFDNAHLEDLRLPERYAAAGPAYERLKNGENIIAENPERPDAHSTGDRLFVGLDDYGIHGTQLREFVQTLDRMAQGDKIIGVDEIKQAALEVSGKGITPLLDLLRPGIEYNGYYDEERTNQFFRDHPQFATDDVSWVK